MMRIAFPILAAMLAAAPALAQDRPPLKPTRDATVTYRTTGSDSGPHTLRILHAAGSSTMRIEGDSMPGYALVDREAGRTTMVMPDRHLYMELNGQNGQPPAAIPDRDARFTRRGTDTVAGQRCTVWDMASDKGNGTACVTDEGILLRAQGGNGRGMEATAVSYAPVARASLQPPADFQKMDVPNFAARPGPGGGQGFTLPPGVRLPPGVQLPPGVTLPKP